MAAREERLTEIAQRRSVFKGRRGVRGSGGGDRGREEEERPQSYLPSLSYLTQTYTHTHAFDLTHTQSFTHTQKERETNGCVHLDLFCTLVSDILERIGLSVK